MSSQLNGTAGQESSCNHAYHKFKIFCIPTKPKHDSGTRNSEDTLPEMKAATTSITSVMVMGRGKTGKTGLPVAVVSQPNAGNLKQVHRA